MTVFAKCYAKIFVKSPLSMFCTKRAAYFSAKLQSYKTQARRFSPAGLLFNTRFRRRICHNLHRRIHPR